MDQVQTYLDNLVTARGRAWNEAKELLDVATGENREFTGEEQQKWERINADLDAKDEQIRSFRDRISAERENDVLREAVAPVVQRRDADPLEVAGRENPNGRVNDWLAGRGGKELTIDLASAYRAKQLVREGHTADEVRDLLVGTTTAGGYTVPTSLSTQLVDHLEAMSSIRKTNVTVITRSSGETFNVPTVTSHGTAAVLGEGTAAAEADAALGQVALTFYKYAQLLQVSSELLTDTAVDITGFIAKDMGRALARVTDAAFLTGSGTNAPSGALVKMGTATTIQTVATGVPSYTNLVDTVYSINPLYQANQASWLMRQAMGAAIRKVTDTTGRPLWEPSLIVGQPDTLLGFPVYYDPNLGAVGTAASTAIAFGDWSAYYIGQVGSVEMARSDDFAFSSGLSTYRATWRVAGNLVDLTGAVKKVIEPTT